MGAISSFSTAVGVLARSRALLGVALLASAANLGLAAVPATFPEPMAGLVSLPLTGITYLVLPFFVGGMLAMAEEGLDGVGGLGAFAAGGKSNYLRLLASMLLFGVVFGILAFVVMLGLAVVGIFVVGVNATGAGSSLAAANASVITMALLALVGLLVLMIPPFFLQFYAPAIVVSDLGVVESFQRSAGLVRRNLASTLGYSAIAGLAGSAAGVAGVVASLLGGTYGDTTTTGAAVPEVGLGVVAAAAVLTVVVTTLVSAFGVVYQVAFYTDRLDSLA
ncbi:hypothetical protein NGM10_01925 [Halorussus salilacus]|uniref:DUF7847 domain-containing protein n=1 Tax=Halorussus salilacus TaxID=2953750 RepID=UPI00209D3EE1|nr:hypothetical protein [Halorussus salilacus]USZ68510.1 hypothetical protein NGM10_01925 [Halorussus salilacus]